jgi:N-acetylglutamate synthase-like GNAT family acetyltransferase
VPEFEIHISNILMQTNVILEVLIETRCNDGMEIEVRPLRTAEDAAAFRRLNEEWIAAHFVLEDEDRRQLEDPVAAYVEPGGEILMAELDGVVGGCVAIVPDGTGAFELSKMAVAPALRGRGAGRRLLTAAVERARELGATSLFLGSSTKLLPAVHLYESVGFRHVPRESLHMPYARATVFMRMELSPVIAPR